MPRYFFFPLGAAHSGVEIDLVKRGDSRRRGQAAAGFIAVPVSLDNSFPGDKHRSPNTFLLFITRVID